MTSTLILLLAYDRPDYLAQVIAGIKRMRGWRECTLIASIDQRPDGTHNQEVIDLCKQVTRHVCPQKTRLDCNEHVHRALRDARDMDPDHILYLEDDIVPAADCLEFCYDMIPTMRHNQRIKAMTLLGQNHGDVHVAWRNRQGFKAHRWFNAWGNFYQTNCLSEILDLWPDRWDSSTIPWDTHVNGEIVIDHEFLVLTPLLSRVQNVGVVGRFCKGQEDFKGRVRDFWSDSDFSRPIRSNFR